jgi:hypothetical protein
MPESSLTARTTSPAIAEWFLARITDSTRAAAILGDLTEMAATRGRRWFWITYVRTLVSLGWRTPLAVIAAIVSVKYLRRSVLRLVFRLLYAIHLNAISFNDSRMWFQHHSHLAHLAGFSWDVSLGTLFTLWILLPYVAIRFGLRNRLTYLSGTLFLLAIPVNTLRPQIYQFTGLACALIIVAALASALWRRQMIFLLAGYALNQLVYFACYYAAVAHSPAAFRDNPFPLSLFGMRIDDPVGIAVTVMICPLLYRWLLQRPPATDRTIA